MWFQSYLYLIIFRVYWISSSISAKTFVIIWSYHTYIIVQNGQKTLWRLQNYKRAYLTFCWCFIHSLWLCLKTDPRTVSPNVFVYLIKSQTSPEFTWLNFYKNFINCVSFYTGKDLKAYKSLDANLFLLYMLGYKMIFSMVTNVWMRLHNAIFVNLSYLWSK